VVVKFIADKIKALLISKGVVAGIVNVSGDINTWKTTMEKWKVAIKPNKDIKFCHFSIRR
jgi:thiamine biosynthesis lipoprotein